MRDIQKIQANIANTRLQLSIVETAAETAPDTEKDQWRQKRATLELRLEELEQALEEAEKESLATDAQPTFMQTEAEEPSAVFADAETDAMFGGMSADDVLNSILATPEAEVSSDNAATDTMADAMLESILTAQDNRAAVIDDETADAMLDSILSMADSSEEQGVVIDNETADAMLDSILSMNGSEEASGGFAEQDADAVSFADEPIIVGESVEAPDENATIYTGATEAEDSATIVMPPQEEIPDTIYFAQEATPQEEATDTVYAQASAPQEEIQDVVYPAQESAVQEEIPDTIYAQEATPQEEATDTIYPAREAAPQEEVTETVYATQASAPQADMEKMTDALLAKILSATDAAIEQKQREENLSARAEKDSSDSGDPQTMLQIEKLKLETEDANRRAQAALFEAEKMRKEAEQIKLAAETERAMYAAEMELQRGLRHEEEHMRSVAEQAAKDRLAEKIARRKTEITAIRNDLQDVKDSDSAFLVREKLFSVQLVLDEDERNSPEISYLLTKSMDDVSHSLEVAELKRRIAALTAALTSARKAASKPQPKKKPASAPKAKPTKKKEAAKKKKKKLIAAARRRPGVRGYAVPRRRYVLRPSAYHPRYLR